VHAAGLEESVSVARKSAESFDRILQVKASGLRALLKATARVPVHTLVLTGSVSARLGNKGQTDYAAGNELLAKAAAGIRRRPGLRVVCLGLGGFDDAGMATRGQNRVALARQGINLIPLVEGVDRLMGILENGRTGEYVLMRNLGDIARTLYKPGVDLQRLNQKIRSNPEAYPMLAEAVDWTCADGLSLEVLFDPARDGYLDDHRINGRMVVPGVMAVEAFAEAVQLLSPRSQVVSVEDLHFHKALKLYDESPRKAQMRILPVLSPANHGCFLATMESTRILPDGREQRVCHFQGVVRTGMKPPPTRARPMLSPSIRKSLQKDQIYQVYFQGPGLQLLDKATTYANGAVSGTMQPDKIVPSVFRSETLAARPLLTELAFQTAVIYQVTEQQSLGLPEAARRIRIHKVPLRQPKQVTAWVVPVSVNSHVEYEIHVVDENGTILLEINGYRTTPFPLRCPPELKKELSSNPDEIRPALEVTPWNPA
jgi:hypothetical protein